jgi:YD repeat-containing protein
MGSGIPPTLTAYGASGTRWTTLVTDANRCQVQTLTDILGHTVEHDVQNNALNASGQCSGTVTWLPTKMNYDVAGHLLQVTDPLSNQTTFQYDGLGRKTQMTAPDMGSWSYQYDNNGNLTEHTDARKATTYLHYDPLNRISIKDLPYYALSTSTWTPGTPGEEDEVSYYDSNLPSTCYSCDDHCAVTTDTCDTATLTCSHSGPSTCPTSCMGPSACTPGATQSCGNCGTQTCGSDCSWGACSGEGPCAPGAAQSCGNCGTETCSSSCSWGGCEGQGWCSPGATQACGCEGTESCLVDCTWGICGGQRNITCYVDADHDGYGNPNTGTEMCGSCNAGYVTDHTDCYDANANAHPGQTIYFPVNRGDGSFDYNCDGAETKDRQTYTNRCYGLDFGNCIRACTPAICSTTAASTPACGDGYTVYLTEEGGNCETCNGENVCMFSGSCDGVPHGPCSFLVGGPGTAACSGTEAPVRCR